MKIFSSSKKAPAEVVKSANDCISLLKGDDKTKSKKAIEELIKKIHDIKELLNLSAQESIQAAELLVTNGFMNNVLEIFGRLDVDAQNDVATIFKMVLPLKFNTTSTIEFLNQNVHVIQLIVNYCGDYELCPRASLMLQQCASEDSLSKILIEMKIFYSLFEYCLCDEFTVSGSALQTIESLFRDNPTIFISHIETHHDLFFSKYHVLITSQNYAVKRTCLKLMSDILSHKLAENVKRVYISKVENFELFPPMMIQLSVTALYAFEIFKFFMFDSKKDSPVYTMLIEKQQEYIETLQTLLKNIEDLNKSVIYELNYEPRESISFCINSFSAL